MIANMSVSREKEAFSSLSFSFLSKHTGQSCILGAHTHTYTYSYSERIYGYD